MRDLDGRCFVLVHGAWHGGWCWDEVAARLRARGATVYAPSFTGMGERAAERDRFHGLETWLEDIAAVLRDGDLHDVLLVGHSFGGMVITGIADRMPERIAQLVYLDAAVPKSGQSMMTQNPEGTPEFNEQRQAELEARRDEWLAPPPPEKLGMGATTPAVLAREQALMTPHPMASFLDRLVLQGGGAPIPSSYIGCANPPMPHGGFVEHHAHVAAGDYGAHWHHAQLPTGHLCMATDPDRTAAALADAVLAWDRHPA